MELTKLPFAWFIVPINQIILNIVIVKLDIRMKIWQKTDLGDCDFVGELGIGIPVNYPVVSANLGA